MHPACENRLASSIGLLSAETRPVRPSYDVAAGILPGGMPELLAAKLIRDVPDFPKPGILFKDITPVLEHADALQEAVDLILEDAQAKGAEVIVGIESRGFIFGIP